MKTLLLCLLMSVEATSENGVLTISVPEPPLNHKYGEAWLTIGPTVYRELESRSPGLWQIAAEGNEGTLSVTVCGPETCFIEDFEWEIEQTKRPMWPGVLIVAAFLCYLGWSQYGKKNK